MTLDEGSRSFLEIWRFMLSPGGTGGVIAFLNGDLAILRVPNWRFGDLRPPPHYPSRVVPEFRIKFSEYTCVNIVTKCLHMCTVT